MNIGHITIYYIRSERHFILSMTEQHLANKITRLGHSSCMFAMPSCQQTHI